MISENIQELLIIISLTCSVFSVIYIFFILTPILNKFRKDEEGVK